MKYEDAMAMSRRFTSKYRHYGALYDLVLETLPRQPTVVEVGIANGGSLQTWRTLLGPAARIVGIDLNEGAVAMREEGFEVIILDTGSRASWDSLQRSFPKTVDLLVDDGGHTNRQQISTLLHGVELVRDGGWIVVEDLHASFMKDFGNPSPYSTARFLNQLSSDLHRLTPRSQAPPKHPHLAASVDYMLTAPSWAGLRIRRERSESRDEVTGGVDTSLMDYDHRWDSSIGRHVVRLLPRRFVRMGRNTYMQLLTALESRRLFGEDASGPIQSSETDDKRT